MSKYLKMVFFYISIIVIVVLAVTFFNPVQREIKTITYSELINHLEHKEVKEIELNDSSVSGKLSDGTEFTAVVPSYVIDQQVAGYIAQNPDLNVTVAKPVDSWWISLIPSAVVIIMMVVFFMIFSQQTGGGGKVMNYGKSKAKMTNGNETHVTFRDVAGADEEKQELEEIVDFLKTPDRYHRLGARIPKGVLLVGPPGTGKTLLAKAVAGEAGVPFFFISGSDFVEMFVGVGASRVRDLFESAKKNSPCIIFIDEIDAVGRHRGAGLGGGHDEREQTLNQLLVEMDGFGVHENVIVVAATNRPDILDPALLRPGRFDRQITVGTPDVKGREAILNVHKREKPIDSSVDLGTIAKGTPGFTGADLENLMNEAALLTARNKKKVITMTELEEAIKRVVAGPEKKSRVVTDEDKRITAYHEAGHAIVMEYLHNGEEVHEISIIPRGMAAGYTISFPMDDSQHMTRGRLMDRIAGLLGGRAAEKVALEDICTGASNDIERATEIAKKMITEWGMSDKLGPMKFGSSSGGEIFLGRDLNSQRDFSEEVASIIDEEVRDIVESSFEKAVTILEEKQEVLETVAQTLLKDSTISGEEFREIYHNVEVQEAEIIDNDDDLTPPTEDDQKHSDYDDYKKKLTPRRKAVIEGS